MKSLLRNYALRFVRRIETRRKNDTNIEIFIQEILRKNDISTINNPFAYVDFLRGCFEPLQFSIKMIKESKNKSDSATKRFLILLDILKQQVPPIPSSLAHDLALFNDRMVHMVKPVEHGNMAADVGFHFSKCSSSPPKGRLLSTIIRFCQSESCLEVGTGYGFSALFILNFLKTKETQGHLTTLEGFEPQYSLSSQALKSKFGDMVSCHFGKTEDVLADIVSSMDKISFMFHDGGHYKENYIRDFANACTAFVPGSVVLFDDIRYEDKLIDSMPRNTYDGWMEVVNHCRVKMAVELDGNLGLLLLK